MTTVVGSCVSVCLRDPVGAAGGMSHYLLPQGTGSGATRLRYANHAIAELVERVSELAGAGSQLQAKIVGGASVLPSVSGRRRRFGLENVEAAHQLLARADIEVVAEVVGGHCGRRVIFDVTDGSMWVQDLGDNPGGE